LQLQTITISTHQDTWPTEISAFGNIPSSVGGEEGRPWLPTAPTLYHASSPHSTIVRHLDTLARGVDPGTTSRCTFAVQQHTISWSCARSLLPLPYSRRRLGRGKGQAGASSALATFAAAFGGSGCRTRFFDSCFNAVLCLAIANLWDPAAYTRLPESAGHWLVQSQRRSRRPV